MCVPGQLDLQKRLDPTTWIQAEFSGVDLGNSSAGEIRINPTGPNLGSNESMSLMNPGQIKNESVI